jgi:integrase
LHDLRHTFAVQTLLRWHREGLDVNAWLPRLSTYLGHANPSSTYWYLTASPELMALVGRKLERALGALP